MWPHRIAWARAAAMAGGRGQRPPRHESRTEAAQTAGPQVAVVLCRSGTPAGPALQGYGVDERRPPARRAEHRNHAGTRLSPLVADRGLDLGGRAAPAQHADVDVERAGRDLAGEHGGTGPQELSWVADFQAGGPQR